MNCTAGSRASGSAGLSARVNEFLSDAQPGSSWMEDPSPEYAGRRQSGGGGKKSQPSRAAGALPSSELSLTTLAVRRRSTQDDDEQFVVATNQTRVQASKSSAKIILDDHQTGYLAVVPPDIERDLMKYTAPARNGQIGPRPIKPSMLFEFDYRPKISSLLPHESHKEISAHLNIAWKSIGQDILQLYKDLAKKVEQKLKILNGEISQVSHRAVSKRKSGDNSRTSREPPANSGLRRCNCRPDCPKYKIIPGSDLEKRWISRFNRGGEREKSVVLDATESHSDFGVDPQPSGVNTFGSTPKSSSGPHLFGGSRSSSSAVAPQNQRLNRQEEADELPDDLLLDSSFHSSIATSQHQLMATQQQQQQQQQYHRTVDGSLASSYSGPRPGEAVSSPPIDIAQAAAVAANVDPHQNVYYATQMDQQQLQMQQQHQLQQQLQQQQLLLQQQQQQQQHMIYNPIQGAGYQPALPYVDPHNQEQMAQLQGSYIYPNGIIVNAFGEEIARTLPPSEFANLAAAAPAASSVSEGFDHKVPRETSEREAASVAAVSSHETTTDSAVGSGREAVPASPDAADMVVNTSNGSAEVYASVNAESTRDLGNEETTNVVEAEIGIEVVDAGQVADVQVGIEHDEIASNVTSPLSSVAEEVDAGLDDGPLPSSAHPAAVSAATPEPPSDGVDSEASNSRDSAHSVREQPTASFTWHKVQGTPGRQTDSASDQESPAFTWHQVQAAEGREAPAQEIGWSWKKNSKEMSASLSDASSVNGDKKDEDKEKAFALQANFAGIETESTEFAEIKMGNASVEGNDATSARLPPLDPRQDMEEEVEEKAELKALRSEQGEEEDDEDEMPADDDENEEDDGREEDDGGDDREEGEIVDDSEDESAKQMNNDPNPPQECASSIDVGIHNLTASDFDEGVGDPQMVGPEAGAKDFLDDSRSAE